MERKIHALTHYCLNNSFFPNYPQYSTQHNLLSYVDELYKITVIAKLTRVPNKLSSASGIV